MPEITILTESELRQCVPLDLEAVSAVSDAFVALASGDVVMPPILRLDVEDHNGEIDVKTAYMRGLDSFAVKMSPGFFDNPKLGLPSVNGLMVVFSAKTGLLEALLLDNGYLTDVRTAAAGAVAAKHLARENAEAAGVIGAGVQARMQIEALKLVRDFKVLRVWARDKVKAMTYAEEMGAKLGVEASVAPSPRALVEASDIVVATTPSREPLIDADWLHPGLHITAMGSDAEHKNELDPWIVASCDRFVCDTREQSARLGELHHAIDKGAVPADAEVTELGQVIAGTVTGRATPDDITVCDLTGTGAQDTAISRVAVEKARTAGFGSTFTS